MAFDLTGKRALITGGTAGIGLAVATRFAAHGAEVVISGRRDEGDAIAGEIGAQFIKADVSDADEIAKLFSHAESRLGGLDIAVNNAGVSGGAMIADETVEQFDRLMDINVRSAFFVLQAAARRVAPGGSIINTASVAALEGRAGASVYWASKAPIVSFTKSASIELAPRNIRVNAVSPGVILSEMWTGDAPNEWAKRRVPLQRPGGADEAAAVYQFLASDEASYVTGANYLVDGGYCAGEVMRET